MMTAFHPKAGLIVVETLVVGPTGAAVARLALDTGATATAIDGRILVASGIDVSSHSSRVQMTTASGVAFVTRVVVERISALSLERKRFPVLAHSLPPTASISCAIIASRSTSGRA